jgi:hypothetical protein
MAETRPWYREPETFIALAALVVSLTAVIVGVYEAALQRAHDRAEVWPHLELSTWIGDSLVSVRLDNTGLGPGVVKFVEVRVDGKPERNWKEALRALYGHEPPRSSSATTVEHALRPGDRVTLFALPMKGVQQDFWPWIGRVSVQVCYASIFDSFWMVTDTMGKSNRWEDVRHCPPQPAITDL